MNRYFNKTILLIVAIFFLHDSYGQYKEGYYYQKDGTKVDGLLRLQYGGNGFKEKSNGDCYISFKETREHKRVKLTTKDICCFVIGKDSFAIVKNFTLNFMVHYPRDFAQVLQDGKIKLYLYYSVVSNSTSGGMMSSRTIKEWVIEKEGLVEKLRKKAFKKMMPVLIDDCPELKEKLARGELRFRDTPEIIKTYNDYFAVQYIF